MIAHADHDDAIDRAPFARLGTVERQVDVETRDDGALLLKDPRALPRAERSMVAYLRHWSQVRPDSVALAERGPDGAWIELGYGQMRRRVDAVAQALLDRGLAPGQTILILSGNSIEHAVLALAAMTVGVAVAPVSPAYSLSDAGLSKLMRVFEAVRPAMIFVQDWRRFEPAIRRLGAAAIPVVAVSDVDPNGGVIPFADLLAATPTPAVEAAFGLTGHDTVAKILFSSGSTGWPKGIVNTQGMLCVNMAMVDAMWEEAEHTKPHVTLNWMPWNHTMAGNGLFNRSLRQGGAYYIDDGRPGPDDFQRTLRNLRDISPHSYSDVPAGFAMLTSALEADDDLLARFFRNLEFVQYAGASLPGELWRRFQKLAVRATGERMPFLTGYGCTEMGPLVTQLYWPVVGSGFIGVPVPGVELKLVPVDAARWEVRTRGPNLTPGYVGEPELYAATLDEEGFYRTGDAVTFVDRADPLLGLRFASRVAEDFKLLTGTFVAVGGVRANAVGALMPLVSDLVVTGHDREFVGALAWPDLAACRRLCGDHQGAQSIPDLLRSPEVVAAVKAALAGYNQAHAGSSMRIARVLLLEEPPSAEANEITEKGYVNQRAALERRAAMVERLYADPPGPDVIIIDPAKDARPHGDS
ncbi:MAG: AMP-dependent synthetase and ligase [Phenylobacterium sp.]|nr:AMP-dependent synthetase and ligase [Phenylobacterium sp.]